jgi:hypothetical protein
VFFDQGTPVPLPNHLSDHQVSIVYELGWGKLEFTAIIANATVFRETKKSS